MRYVRSGPLGSALALAVLACGADEGPQVVGLSGLVRDYFSAAAVGGATLAMPPAVSVTSTASGAYQFSGLPTNASGMVSASLATYRTTRNEVLAWTTSSVVADQFMVAAADAQRQYTGLGLTAAAGTAVVFVNLVDAAGQPHTGLPIADVTLTATAGGSPGGIGPFVFGSGGDVVSNATLSVTTAFNGRTRVAFLDVPPGIYTLRVNFTSGTAQTKTATVTASAGEATLVRR